ncbi:uncharacterized protein [Branchiostoma lanceolatum]|uniref:uncharacterized protein n=1 Tax=Branchiostoma lanceolatum TaxID=7740 RepID=UPI0034550A9B
METATRPGPVLSATQLILVEMAPFVGCSVVVGVIAACVRKRKGVRQQDNADGQRNAANKHYENDYQLSYMAPVRVITYENDDRLSDTDGANGVHCENEDQFSDDDNPHETIPHTLTNDKPGKTSSLAKAENGRRRRIQRRLAMRRATSGRSKAKSNVTTILAEVHAQAQASGHHDNDKDSVGLHNSETATSGRCKAKRNVSSTIAEVNAQTQASEHYDNDKNSVELSSIEATTSLDNAASDDGH